MKKIIALAFVFISLTTAMGCTRLTKEEISSFLGSTSQTDESIESTDNYSQATTQVDTDPTVKEFDQREGLQFKNLSKAKDTDKVSMVNLYKAPFTGEFADIDAEFMHVYNNNIKTELDTGKTVGDREFVRRYLQQLYDVKGIFVKEFQIVGEKIIIDTAPVIENKFVLENKPYYENIQNVISALGIHKGMSQKEAIERFNSYICGRVSYNYDSKDASLDTFFRGKAICNSYAQVFEILCRTVGIDCKFIGGTALSPQGNYENHAWNKITFSDGTVYYFDTCWNDADIVINGETFQRKERYMFVTEFASRNIKDERIIGYYEY